MKVEVVKSKKQVALRAASVLLYKLATANSENVVAISKELEHWYNKIPNQEFRSRQ